MFRIDPEGFYSRTDLIDHLEPAGIDVDTFLSRLRPRKVFKRIWLGEDILAAYRNAHSLHEENEKGTGFGQRALQEID